MVDIVLLQKEIDNLGIPKETLAEKCNMSIYTLDNKLKNPRTITANDCYSFCTALRISEVGKIMRIFFAPNMVHTCTQGAQEHDTQRAHLHMGTRSA